MRWTTGEVPLTRRPTVAAAERAGRRGTNLPPMMPMDSLRRSVSRSWNPRQRRGVFPPNLPGAVDDELGGCELFDTHGAARVQLLRADAHLGAEAEHADSVPRRVLFREI